MGRAPIGSALRNVVVALTSVLLVTASVLAASEPLPVKLRVGLAGIEPGMAGLWMAQEAGFFAKEGLGVEFVTFASGTEGVQALVAKDLAVTSVGGPPVVRAVLAGADITVVAELLGTAPYSLITSPSVGGPSGLKGKKLAISKFGTSSESSLRHILSRLGLDPAKDVTILQIEDSAARFAALQVGRIDGTVAVAPETLVARRLGFKELADASRFPLQYSDNVLAASREFIDKKPETLRRFLRALIYGTQYFKTHPKEGVLCLGKYLRSEDQAGLGETYRVFSALIPPNPIPTLVGIQTILGGLRDSRAQSVGPQDFVDQRVARELEESGLLKRLYPE